jgi:hypothetical protein
MLAFPGAESCGASTRNLGTSEASLTGRARVDEDGVSAYQAGKATQVRGQTVAGKMAGKPTRDELSSLYEDLSDEERLDLLKDVLVACSHGWRKVLGLLESRVLDHEVRRTIDALPQTFE